MATVGERRSTHVPHVPLPIFHALAIALILASVSTRSQTGSVVSMGWAASGWWSRDSLPCIAGCSELWHLTNFRPPMLWKTFAPGWKAVHSMTATARPNQGRQAEKDQRKNEASVKDDGVLPHPVPGSDGNRLFPTFLQQ